MRGSTEPSDLIDGLTRIFSERGLREGRGEHFQRSSRVPSSFGFLQSPEGGGRGEKRGTPMEDIHRVDERVEK